MFSCTKGLVAALVGQLVESGLCDPGSPVALYWPEFATVSATLTVRQMLEHRAGELLPILAGSAGAAAN
jgi:CubicO group peptidase (beta-lactamase class C family)